MQRTSNMLVVLAFAFLPLVTIAAPGTPKPSSLALATEPDNPLAVDLEASRSQLVAGEGLGIIARVKNISKKPIYISEQSFTLTVPIEMEGKRAGVTGLYAYFPTEVHKQTKAPDPPVESEVFYQGKLALAPGDTYSVFWTNTWGDNPPTLLPYILDQITSKFQFLFFYPGKYSITLNAKVWTDANLPEDKYRTLSKNIVLPVVAPLFVILLGSALGGLIAYTLFPQTVYKFTDADPLLSRLAKRFAGVLGSILLSIIVTITLSRVSETHFLISVTVNDVWGAIVTGFVANYAGYRILQKFFPGAQSQTPEK